MRLMPVDSEGVRAVGYEEERKILYIQYPERAIYEYFDVPVSEFIDLIHAESIGWFVNKRIKPYYHYRKLATAS
ncbi:MAG TPA: KTSC domain-containing protein [Nitrospira sp.]|nr:KTSC domain-containing protein [Nitrospira sp.]